MSSGSHLSKELFDLVKSIGESRSKQEEDKIITQEVNLLKAKITEPSIPPKKMKEHLLRAIYIEMLGHDASFAYIHAINLAQSSSLIAKRIGYLTCSLCLSQESHLIILLVATLQRDLQSQNYLEVSAALTVICKLVNVGMMHAISDHVVRLLSHPNEIVRKKAVMVLTKFIKLNPSLIPDYNEHFRRALCDKDPSVMGSSLNAFWSLLQDEKIRPHYKDLISSFVVILKQIIDHRLPRDYDYHRMPAPWFQIQLLEILGMLGQDDQKASEQMYEILSEVMRRADDTGVNAGYAIVYQCLKTITQVYPNPALINSAALCISRFLTSDNHNLKYTGITGLISIVKIDPTQASQHQMVVVDCLEDTDDTLKRKTLSLLFRMTNPSNVRVIIEKLMGFLRSTSFDSHLKEELVNQITDIAERFAPDSRWYLETMNGVFELSGEHVKPGIVNNLVRLIDEWRDDPESIRYTTEEYLAILERSTSVNDAMMQVAAWVLGEFAESLDQDQQSRVMTILCKALHWRFEDTLTKGWILTALQKLGRGVPSDDVRELVSKFSSSRNEDLQQRCYEFAGVCTKLTYPISFKENLGKEFDLTLTFLDDFVRQKLMDGARPYDPEKSRRGLSYLINKGREEYKVSEAFQAMKMDPYEAPKVDSGRPYLVSTPGAPPVQEVSVDRELKVTNRLWTNEGYKGQTPAEQPRPVQGGINLQPSISSTFNPGRSQPPKQKTQKEIEKERFAQSLFGGGGNEPAPPQPPQPVQRPDPRAQQPPPQQKKINDLLEL